jgi:hypothetical protein
MLRSMRPDGIGDWALSYATMRPISKGSATLVLIARCC